MKTLKSGEDFSFPREFGFTGSAAAVSPRAHPTMSQDEFGDDAQLKAESAVPTFANGGQTAGPVGKKMPKAGKAILGALQLGKTIGMVQAAKGAAAGAAPPGGSMPNAAAPGLGPLPRPGAGVIPGALPGQAPGMKKGGRTRKMADGGSVDKNFTDTTPKPNYDKDFTVQSSRGSVDPGFIAHGTDSNYAKTLGKAADVISGGHAKGGKVNKWAGKAFKPSHKGALHRALGVPEGEKIPAGKMESAAHSKSPHLRHMAQAAENINK